MVYCELKNKNARENVKNVFATQATDIEPIVPFLETLKLSENL